MAIKDTTLDQVKNYFRKEVKRTGSNKITIKLTDLADNIGLALNTVFMSIKELERHNYIEVRKASSRKFPNTYVYHEQDPFYRDILKNEIEKHKEEQNIKNLLGIIEIQKRQLKEKDDLINKQKNFIDELQNEIYMLKKELSNKKDAELLSNIIKTIKLQNGTEMIIRKTV